MAWYQDPTTFFTVVVVTGVVLYALYRVAKAILDF